MITITTTSYLFEDSLVVEYANGSKVVIGEYAYDLYVELAVWIVEYQY